MATFGYLVLVMTGSSPRMSRPIAQPVFRTK
jgi:hypothetical protein